MQNEREATVPGSSSSEERHTLTLAGIPCRGSVSFAKRGITLFAKRNETHETLLARARRCCAPPRSRWTGAHASVSWVGKAYDELRKRGVPRERIIVIAQVADYFAGLHRAKAPEVLINNYKSTVRRLLQEGG